MTTRSVGSKRKYYKSFCQKCFDKNYIIECKCGCGNTFGKLNKFRQEREYSKGHYNKGENNVNWNGDNVSYEGLHDWINRNKPKPEDGLCEQCHIRKIYDAANISGKYLRDITDYLYLCRSCHMNNDGRIHNLKYQS